METANPRLTFWMKAIGDNFQQEATYLSSSGGLQTISRPIEMVFGSGRKGHSYAFWNSDQLIELPISYWSATQAWINSPGYPDGEAHFDRLLTPRCLECHTTSFRTVSAAENRIDRGSLRLGIGCERCHGPGEEHIRRERSAYPPQRGSPKIAIVNPSRLLRERQIDLCALCHEGAGIPLAPALSFKPGNVLDHFIQAPMLSPDTPPDVHSNQVQLLQLSRCFKGSAMTCSTCHDVHEQQRDLAFFATRCLACHTMQSCGEYPRLHSSISKRCVACHMPLQQSQGLFSVTAGKRVMPQIRTHRIAIYPEPTL